MFSGSHEGTATQSARGHCHRSPIRVGHDAPGNLRVRANFRLHRDHEGDGASSSTGKDSSITDGTQTTREELVRKSKPSIGSHRCQGRAVQRHRKVASGQRVRPTSMSVGTNIRQRSSRSACAIRREECHMTRLGFVAGRQREAWAQYQSKVKQGSVAGAASRWRGDSVSHSESIQFFRAIFAPPSPKCPR